MMDRRFALTPLGKPAWIFALVLAVLLPLAIAVMLSMEAGAGKIDPLVALACQALVAVVVLAIVLPLWRREAAFDGRRLRVKAAWYTRESPLADFDLDAARAVDTREHTELKPRLKTNGYALPGFWAGHFRLRDRQRAFCLVTDPSKVVVLPHADGRLWLLSVEHPQAVLDILRRARAS
jgi:hypothetical protein